MIVELGSTAGGLFVGSLTALFLYPVFFQNIAADGRIKMLRRTIVLTLANMIGASTTIGWMRGENVGACYLLGLLVGFVLFFSYLELRAIRFTSNTAQKLHQSAPDRAAIQQLLQNPGQLTDDEVERLTKLLDELSDESK